MIKRFIYYFLEGRHYWRDVSFSEMAELYASRVLRTLAVSMVSIFIAIYLYQNGYGLTFIMFYFAGYFVLRGVLAWPFAYLVARIGPKHATLISNLLYVPALLLFAIAPDYGLSAIIIAGVTQALSVTLYDISYLVGFSKVRHEGHSGKELGYMHMLEQIAKGISPVIGGFIAYWFGPQATLVAASITFGMAALPLLVTPEPVRTHQQITFHGLQLRQLWGGLVAQVAVGFDFVASGFMWSLLVGLSIFGISSNTIYAQLGVLSSITIVVGVASAKVIGLLVDKHRSRELMKAGVVADSMTHILRLFAATPFGVLMINIFNEISTTAYALPITKGYFAQADLLPGYRIVYMSLVSGAAALGAAWYCAIVGLISLYAEEVATLQIGYGIAAIAVLVLLANRLPGLTKRHLLYWK
ncbi:MAG: MFS transporter [Candidatus Saccharimonadales bacterium]